MSKRSIEAGAVKKLNSLLSAFATFWVQYTHLDSFIFFLRNIKNIKKNKTDAFVVLHRTKVANLEFFSQPQKKYIKRSIEVS